jgi:hypothetical protein
MFEDATQPTRRFHEQKDSINHEHRGLSRKLRLFIAEAEYALALHEGRLGAPEVRANWERYFERLWRARRDPESAARETLLQAVAFAESNYSEPHVGWKRPRETFTNWVGTTADGTVLTITVSLPHEDEAAERAIESVARFDPETAATIPAAGLSAIIPVFANRHQNEGRRGKRLQVDAELCKLVEAMGLTPVSVDAMRRQRTRFEEAVGQRRVEAVRTHHLEATRRERVSHGLDLGRSTTASTKTDR